MIVERYAILPVPPQPLRDAPVEVTLTRSAERVDDSLSAPGIEVLHAIPMNSVGPRPNVIEVRIPDQRTQLVLIKLYLLLRYSSLLRAPLASSIMVSQPIMPLRNIYRKFATSGAGHFSTYASSMAAGNKRLAS